jgi:hypothetical protein
MKTGEKIKQRTNFISVTEKLGILVRMMMD